MSTSHALRNAYRNIVRLFCVRRNRNQNTNDAPKHVDQRPPRKVGICLLDIADHRGDESNKPRKLFPLSQCAYLPSLSVQTTYNSNADGSQRERISNNAADAEARLSAKSIHIVRGVWHSCGSFVARFVRSFRCAFPSLKKFCLAQ